MIDTVSALYIDPAGPYPRMVVDCWDEIRDAKRYDGPNPVVAHPPCGPWGRLSNLCHLQDPTCGPAAVASVRRWGGVLEHPAESRLWRACLMPFPGELPDAWSGLTYAVCQVAWGHCCTKPTWLYIVGVPARLVVDGIRTGGVATHRINFGPRGPQLPSAPKERRRMTPPLFGEWLVSLAEAVR